MISEKDREGIKGVTRLVDLLTDDGVSLKKQSGRWVACCPFHTEKTPSFTIDEVKGTYHCFGCGEHGDGVHYLMKTKGWGYRDTMQYLATKYKYQMEEEPQTPEQQMRDMKRRTQLRLNSRARDFFKQCLKQHPEAWAYATSRWSEESIDHWDIGYAPADKFALWNYLLSLGEKIEDLEESTLFTCKNDEVYYSVFYDRITMPIFSNVNEPLAFSARVLNLTPQNKKVKYINSRLSTLYKKSSIIYGWSFALRTISDTNTVVLVEGNADVIKMHEIGITNTVAICGTSFTEEHAKVIAAKAKTVVMIFDGDNAGVTATRKYGRLMLKEGLIPYVLALPTTDADGNPQKNDPDSFFTSTEKYQEYFSTNREHYIQWLTRDKLANIKNPDPSDINSIICEVCDEMMWMPESEREAYVPALSQICGDKKAWQTNLNDRANVATKKGTKKLTEEGMTEGQQEVYDIYGLYEDDNCYWVSKGNYNACVSNFVLQPLFLIEGVTSSKRIFRMTNNRGYCIDLEISTDDMCTKNSFCKVVERRGNFLFSGTDGDLGKIKSYLYDHTKSCMEITQLGWQTDGGFWAWSNGIYTTAGKFIPIDEYGCVHYNKQWYYMAACSSTTSKDKGLYRYERRFVHQQSDADIFTWASKFIATFGENAIIGICYYITSLFRDLAMTKYRSFPLLDIFGQRGSGKTKFVMSLLRLFGKDCEEGPNIGSDTVPAIADQLSKLNNGFVHLDEYKNNIESVKIEILKGAYENRGRGKMDMDNDRKRKQLPMDSGVILSGQEMTTADNALFSRVVYMTFNKTRFTPEQVDIFEDLKKYEEKSLTGITNQILKLRPMIEEQYERCTDEVKHEMRQMVDVSRIEERIVKNYSIMLSIMKAVDGTLNLPFTYKSLLPIFVKYIDRQNSTVSATSEVADFWGGIETLLTNGNLDINYDIIIKTTSELAVNVGTGSDRKKMQYNNTMQVLYLNTSRVFSEYMQYVKRTKTNLQNQCDIVALKSYLTTQDEYLGDSKCYFLKPMKQSQEPDAGKTWTGGESGTTAMKKQSRCLCFNYAKLREEYGIELQLKVGDKYQLEEETEIF